MLGHPPEAPYVAPPDFGSCALLALAAPPAVLERTSYLSMTALVEENPVLAAQFLHLRESVAQANGLSETEKVGLLPQDVPGWDDVFGLPRDETVETAKGKAASTATNKNLALANFRKLTTFTGDPREVGWTDKFRDLGDKTFCRRTVAPTVLTDVHVIDDTVPALFDLTTGKPSQVPRDMAVDPQTPPAGEGDGSKVCLAQ